MTLVLPEDFLVTKALRALDKDLPVDFPSMRLKVVGGYALQVLKIRTDAAEVTYRAAAQAQNGRPGSEILTELIAG
ncbi:MAG: hypothetical protein FWH11_08060 [Micrococcales bacterium]|nr:hypothetical protein [Micrococcales bacterium]